MTATISEDYLSRKFTVGIKNSGRELVYDIIGTHDETAVQTLIEGTAPAVYQGLILDSVEAEAVYVDSANSQGVWKGYARYLTPEIERTFDIGGGTQKVTQSFNTISSYAPPGLVAPDFGGAINVTEDSVEGVDIPGPKFDFTWTQIFADSDITDSYTNTLFQLSRPTKNNASFKGFAAGEVIFLGATGSNRGSGQWSVTFRFSASPNVSGLMIGSIGPIAKLGWHVWVRYADYSDIASYALVKRPVAAYVEEVILDGDFSLLLIGV
jgi:hypothetical protein